MSEYEVQVIQMATAILYDNESIEEHADKRWSMAVYNVAILSDSR
jgi:hypothetical protein